jgi:hypothetical protein
MFACSAFNLHRSAPVMRISYLARTLVALTTFCLALAGGAFAQTPQALRAGAYDPQCGADTACAVWAAFRTQHPFPYQAMAAAKSSDGALVVIVSEPAPVLSRADFEARVRALFGADLLDYANRRWMIGEDGWVEDVVLKLRWSAAQAALPDPLNDRTLRAGIAGLHLALYGTTFGGDLEPADRPLAAIASAAAPDLAPTPAELNAWLGDATTTWRPIHAREARPQSYARLLSEGAQGGFIDNQNQLVIFLVPASARADDAALATLRTPFRQFAVACDALLGGAWTDAGEVTLIGRARRAPLAAIPPLRFETFARLAREQHGELQQSYERDIPLSGKLLRGPMALRDWAPILLSPSLIDSEFGALLNITDQFLKSWSEAGRVQYLYFDYPLRPESGGFAFGDQRLSRMVAQATGASGVLFNWNTAGASAAMSFADMNTLAAGRTSALPVTYGSELVANSGVQTGDQLPRLRALEDQAYDYFVARRDPNLARVVSYTLMYQLFRAASPAPATSAPQDLIAARAAAHAALRGQLRDLLDAIDSGHVAALDPELQSIVAQEAPRLRTRLRQFAAAHRRYAHDRDGLAALLLDPRDAAAGDPALIAEATALSSAIQDVAFMMDDLGAVSAAFAARNVAAPEGRIKTPSIVISWDDTDLMSALLSVGGHNLTARTLRIEADAHATRISLSDSASGRVLHVPQAQAALAAANAHAIARLVEHEGGGVAEIEALLARAAAAPVRNRAEALGAQQSNVPALADRLGDDDEPAPAQH